MSSACRVEDLGKRYLVNRSTSRSNYGYRTFREEMLKLAAVPLRRFRGEPAERMDEFWALRDLNFEIQPGEVVGIIGRNGAGKSTLLKILSRITKPTVGMVELRGRVGSLLEVGTGFHPELTGRENIYLNGAILGMTRADIARKFDDIVAFAEVERFLEMPVKRYSSGMYVRLAFSVAAHLEPEILIVDEVLAVGDIAFQRKCMGRMKEVGQTGCTVLFVSHNMPAVEALCDRAILLDGGEVVHDGGVADLIAEYRRRTMSNQGELKSLFQGGGRVLRSARLVDPDGESVDYIPVGGLFRLRLGLETDRPIDYPTIGVGIDDSNGQRMLTVHTPLSKVAIERVEGQAIVECKISEFPLAPGDYWVKIAISAGNSTIDSEDQAIRFTVVDGELFGEGRGFQRGVCVMPSSWDLVK